jgi:hypothetical protein
MKRAHTPPPSARTAKAPARPVRKSRPAAAARPVIDIDANRRLLNNYRFVEHEGLRLLAGWLPRAATFELKCEMGRTLWEYSQHVNALYLRLREIQSPAFQPPSDPALVRVMRELVHAPDEFGFLLALFREINPSLIRALESHEKATFPNSDQPSVHVISHALLDLRGQMARVEPLLRTAERTGKITAAARQWQRYIARLLAAAGGVSGREKRIAAPAAAPAVRREFKVPREAARDDRFTNLLADQVAMPNEELYDAHTIEEFERYSTEMLAAETVAFILYSVEGMPWEFQYDSARHLYDEVRHCLMGYEWMRAHQMDPFKSPQYVHIYKWRSQFPPVMQYCMLTMGNEEHAFPYRHRRVEAHQQAGDKLSEQFVRYDIADETQHVRFGRRWLPELLKHAGEKRSLADYSTAVLKVWADEYRTGKLTLNVE